jgi:glycosyltransferase involved in cell wall biosynthesis
MNVVVAVDHRFDCTPDGAVWSQTMYAHRFWEPYLDVFDHVRVVARLRPVSAPAPGWVRADGAGVSFVAVPHYLGPWQYLRRASAVRRAIRGAVQPNDAVILRVHSTIPTLLGQHLRRVGHPHAVDVIADPYDIFSPGAVKHPLRPFFRWWFTRRLRRLCATAVTASYVTEQALQRRYPAPAANFVTHFSDVDLPDGAFVAAPRDLIGAPRPISLVTVGSLGHYFKGGDVLVAAVARLVSAGHDVRLVVVGDGKHRPDLEAQARALSVDARVAFRGQLTAGEAVRAELDRADLFVLPSRQEGLPRAMIEAMARALPCIGSTVGGIPELLPAEDLVPANDVDALVRKIAEVISDPDRLYRMSARNLDKAKEYDDSAVRDRRRAFLRHVKESAGGNPTTAATSDPSAPGSTRTCRIGWHPTWLERAR